MATRRTGSQWDALSPAYRKRLISAARTGKLTGTPIQGTPAQVARQARSAYLRGTSLTSARGKHPNRRIERAPRQATERAARGIATNQDLETLSRWQRELAPRWIRDAGTVFSEDTAAILSNVNLLPRNWKSVNIFPGRDANGEPDGTYVVYFVSRKGGKDRKVVLPDRGTTEELENYIRLNNIGTGVGPGETVSSATGGVTFTRIADYQRRIDAGSPATPTQKLPTSTVGRAVPNKRKRK